MIDDKENFCEGYEKGICDGCGLSVLWCNEQRR